MATSSRSKARGGKSLVIVESPAKAKTINKILGTSFVVKASMGHVRDLPKKELGVDITKDDGNGGGAERFEPKYGVLPEKKQVVTELKKAAKESDAVYLACDFDREGEAIAWHIAEILKLPADKARRVVFNEITKSAIERAFKSPEPISMDRVNAQQARRVLDRFVGYELSPLLWRKVMTKLSAGRVQSVAVRLIVERELEIRAFKPEEYWRIVATLGKRLVAGAAFDDVRSPATGKPHAPFEAELKKWAGETLKLPDETSAREVERELRALGPDAWKVVSVESQEKADSPDAPFRTATLQQQASIRHGFSAKKTMRVAQDLYEGMELGEEEGSVGLITYMRTDSLNVAEEAVQACRELVRKRFGEAYLPEKPRRYKSEAKGAQEAHEAIRPTDVTRTPESLERFLDPDHLKLYRLIWNRFVASQMKNAIYVLTTIDVEAGRGLFRTTGKVLKFDGHARVSGVKVKPDEPMLPPLAPGEVVDLADLATTQHFTQPPPRYTEATLVKSLEKLGIGRPSTYATIISTIQARGYVKKEHRKFFATDLGLIVTERLVKHFPDIMEYEFTSRMESELDDVEESRRDWQEVIRDFYRPFTADLERARVEMKHVNQEPVPSPFKCEKCGKKLVYKLNKYGRYLACSGYPDCKNTLGIDEEGNPKPKSEDRPTDEVCPRCGSPMVIKSGRRGEFFACSGYPKCRYTLDMTADGKPAPPRSLPSDEKCEKCGREMVIRRGRRGPFLGCTGYPKCRSTRELPEDQAAEAAAQLGIPAPVPGAAGTAANGGGGAGGAAAKVPADTPIGTVTDEKCDNCGKPMAVKMSRRGRFLGCTGYPECKSAKSLGGGAAGGRPPPQPSGETCDKCGRPMVVRYSRRGPFQGCSGYPECKNAKPLAAGAGAAPAKRGSREEDEPAAGGESEGESGES